MDFTYSKHKECDPATTVARIKDILKGIDIKTEETWTENDVDGCHSVRITVEGTKVGQNGKGTDRDFCLASGYAELMERLQSNYLYQWAHSPAVMAHEGFETFADEVKVSAVDFATMGGLFADYLFGRFSCEGPEAKAKLAQSFIDMGDGKSLKLIPFVHMNTGKEALLPPLVVAKMCGTNGSCAGNTVEEALIQGFSEIYERYAIETILRENIVPPDVPDAYLQKFPSLYGTIEKIRVRGDYEVVVKDCSFGGVYPVVGLIIKNKQKGIFGVSFGAHPSFAVALERTLTEAMQGSSLAGFASNCDIAGKEKVLMVGNFRNIYCAGCGFYHPDILGNDYSFPFTAWDYAEGKSAHELLRNLADICLGQGYDVFIRDHSYLGFNSYQVVIPGMSDIFQYGPVDVGFNLDARQIWDDLHFNDGETKEKILRYMKRKRHSIKEGSASATLGRPLNEPLWGKSRDTELLFMAALHDNGRDADAKALADGMVLRLIAAGRHDEAMFFLCAAKYLELYGIYGDAIRPILEANYCRETVKEVLGIFDRQGGALSAMTAGMECWDCDNCRVLCDYPQMARITKIMKTARKQSGLRQDGLAEVLRGVLEMRKRD